MTCPNAVGPVPVYRGYAAWTRLSVLRSSALVWACLLLASVRYWVLRLLIRVNGPLLLALLLFLLLRAMAALLDRPSGASGHLLTWGSSR